MMPRSIRWRLQVWYGLILAAVVGGFGVTAYQLEYATRVARMDEELQVRSTVLTTAFRPMGGPGPDNFPADRPPPGRRGGPGGPEGARGPRGRGGGHEPGPAMDPPLAINQAFSQLFTGTGSNDFYYVIWGADGGVQARSTNAPPETFRPVRSGTNEWQQALFRDDRRELTRFTPGERCVLVGRRVGVELGELRRRAGWLTIAGLTVLGLGLAVGSLAITRSLRPLHDISTAAAKIADGNLGERVTVTDGGSELGRLAQVLNTTFARLERAFSQQASFTADAAHELRTPVTVTLMHSQNGLAASCCEPEHQKAFSACARSAQRMRRLVDSLLQLARLDAGAEPLEKAPADLARVAQEAVEMIQPLANEAGIILETMLAPAACRGDAGRLGQVVNNLLSNALEHTPRGGTLRVQTVRAGAFARLVVADSGSGISAAHLPHIFDRFYRGDTSRAASAQHAGLGLSICRAIVEAHGGTIHAASVPGQGATFTVQLPGDPS